MENPDYEKSTDNLPVLIAPMACLLDPRYKNLKFKPSVQIKYRLQAMMVRSKILSVNHILTNIERYNQIAKVCMR